MISMRSDPDYSNPISMEARSNERVSKQHAYDEMQRNMFVTSHRERSQNMQSAR